MTRRVLVSLVLAVLAAVAPAPARATATKVTMDPGVGDAVASVSFRALPVDEAFRRVLRDHGVTYIYSGAELTEVRVYRDPVGRAFAPEPPPAPVSSGADDLARLRRDALEDADPAARPAAIDTLTETTDNAFVVETALAVLEREREASVLLSALDLLTGREQVPLEPVLRHVTAWPPAVRLQVLEILSQHRGRDPRVDTALQAAAVGDPDDAVRASARTLLGPRQP